MYQVSDEPLDENTPLIPPSPYGLSKLAQDLLAERACEDDGLDVVIARPFNHAGPRQSAAFAVSSFARQIARIEAGLAPPEIRVGNLDARRDMTDVRDVVEAYHLLMNGAKSPADPTTSVRAAPGRSATCSRNCCTSRACRSPSASMNAGSGRMTSR